MSADQSLVCLGGQAYQCREGDENMANARTAIKAGTITGPATSTRNRVRTVSTTESPFAVARSAHTGSRHVDSIQVAFTFECSLPSQVAAISPFIDEFMRLIAPCSGVPGSETDLEIALREAVVNAVVHGNHENPRKQVYVRCHCQRGEISIKDEGEGFDADKVPDPTAPENIQSPRGRGIYLMRRYMDEVRFEENGRAVLMRRTRRAQTTSAIVPSMR